MKLLGDDLDTKYVVCLFIDLVEAIPLICRTFVKELDDNILPHSLRINPDNSKKYVYVAFKKLVSSAVIDTIVALDTEFAHEYNAFANIVHASPEEIVEKINEEAKRACEL